jgi:hypothetical protein
VDWPRSLRAYLAVIAAGDLAWEALHVPLYTWGRARRRLGRGGRETSATASMPRPVERVCRRLARRGRSGVGCRHPARGAERVVRGAPSNAAAVPARGDPLRVMSAS